MTVETVVLDHYQVVLDDNLSAKLEVILRQEKINSDHQNPLKKKSSEIRPQKKLACPLAIPLSRQTQLPSGIPSSTRLGQHSIPAQNIFRQPLPVSPSTQLLSVITSSTRFGHI